jgi:TolB-like protein
MSNFVNELKRRNVIKAAIAYAVVAWVVLQVLSLVLPNVGAPEWVMKTLTILAIVGFPVWLFISWVYEVTPDGLKKTKEVSIDKSITANTNKRLNVLILVGLALAIGVSFFNRSPNGTTNAKELLALDNSIAVLPFDDMSSGGDTEWFCDGVTEDILTNLSKLKELKVISRTSTERYKNTDKSIPEIAAELGVSFIVEGSVRKHEDKVIITAQLIDANDTHVWAENYNDDFKEVFKIQQDVSQKIVSQLKIAISPEEEKVMTTAPTDNVEAYQLVLKGKDLVLNAIEKKNAEDSVILFEEAISLDKNYAEAYAELGYANLMLFFWNNSTDQSYLKKSRENIDKALLINPNTAKAYTTRAIIHDELNDGWEESFKDYEKAIELNPNDALAHSEFGLHYTLRPEEDNTKYLYHTNKALELDPLSTIINIQKVDALTDNELFDEAETHLNKISNLIGENRRLFLTKDIIDSKYKDKSKRLEYLLKEHEDNPKSQHVLNHIATVYDGVLNDDENAVKYLKLAYEADSSNAATARSYQGILNENNQFIEADKFAKTANYLKISSELQKKQGMFYYLYHQEKYLEVEQLMQDSLMATDGHLNALVYAQLGKRDKIAELFAEREQSFNTKAFAYAILKERDSMYFYLNKDDINDELVNSRREFDPYRKEERYLAFMKKNYLPIIKKYNGKLD